MTETAGETNELAGVLERRQKINEGEMAPEMKSDLSRSVNIYTSNPDMSKKSLDEIKAKFEEADEDRNGILDREELKRLFERLGAPQTHTAITQLIREVDEDGDGAVNLKEFIKIFRKAASEVLDESSPLKALARLTEIDVGSSGVKGAANFFQAQIEKSKGDNFAREIEEENRRKKEEAELKKKRQEELKAKTAMFDKLAGDLKETF